MLEFRGHGCLMVCSIKDTTKRKAALTWLLQSCAEYLEKKESCKRAEILLHNYITCRCLARLEIFIMSLQPLHPATKNKMGETLTLVDLISRESPASNLKTLLLVTPHFTPPIPTQYTSLLFYFSKPLITWAPRFNKQFNPFFKINLL